SHEIHRYSVCAIPQPAKTINLRVGCEFRYDVSAPTVATVQVRPRSDARHQLVTETWSTQPPVPIDEYADFYGNPVKRLVMPQGELALRYDAVVAVPDEPDLDATGAPQLPADNIPGRYVFGYLPDIYVPPNPAPMDFAAWMEVYLGDRWWTFDPRNNERRVGRVLIGRGRDALDVAMLTTFGPAVFRSMAVWADPDSAGHDG